MNPLKNIRELFCQYQPQEDQWNGGSVDLSHISFSMRFCLQPGSDMTDWAARSKRESSQWQYQNLKSYKSR